MIASQLMDSGGELTPELEHSLKLNGENLQEKAVQLSFLVKDLEYQEGYCAAEIDRINKIKTAACKAQERLKLSISDAMLAQGITEIKIESIKLSFLKSKAVVITDESLIPDFLKERTVTEKINKTEIKKLLNEGHIVSGAAIEVRQNLQIK